MPNTAVNDYIAGAIGGAAGTIVGHPFDTIKVQIQTQGYGARFGNLRECLQSVSSQSLSKGFFRGLSMPLFFHGSLDSVFFGVYGMALRKMNCYDSVLSVSDKPPQYLAICAASVIASVPLVILTCPIEVITITLQAQIPKPGSINKRHQYFKGPIETVSTIVKSSGLRGMYRGFWTQAASYLPGGMLYMSSYTMFQYNGHHLFPKLSPQIVNFLGGGFTGVLTGVLFLPLDVIKSKLQADSSRLLFKGFWDCVRKVYISEGMQVFFLGFWPMTLRAFPTNAVVLMCYSECAQFLNNLDNSKVNQD